MDEASLPARPAEPGAPRYDLLIQVPEAIGAELAARTRHVPGTSLPPQGYHVTLYGPFSFLDDPEDSRRLLREFLRGVSPFSIQLGGIGSFSAPEDNVVFIRVRCTPELLRLHARLVNTARIHAKDQCVDSRLYGVIEPNLTGVVDDRLVE